MPKMIHFGEFFAYSQTVLPDRSLLKGRKLVENAKIEKSLKQGRPPQESEKGAVRCCRRAMRGYNSGP